MADRLLATNYFGGKNRARLQDTILSLLAPNHGYVEPFCGSCAILLNRERSNYEIINDIDEFVTTFFFVLREKPDQLIEKLMLTPFSRAERLHCQAKLREASKNGDHLDDLETARCWFTAIATSQRGLVTGGFRDLTAQSGGFLLRSITLRVKENLAKVAERLHGVGIESCDGVELLHKIADRPDWTAYIDPPYPLESRTGAPAYLHDSDDDLHSRLLDVCTGAKCQIVLSTYDSDLYREKLSSWYRQELDLYKTASQLHNQRSVEVIYANRLPPPIHAPADMTRCSFPDCRNPAFQKSTGLCRSHVSQLGRTGELKPLRKYRNAKPQSPDGLCIKPGCNDAAQSRGLCPKHLWAAHPRRNPNKKPITIMPSESAISKVVKPKPLPPPIFRTTKLRYSVSGPKSPSYSGC